jgi:hypothetical protein
MTTYIPARTSDPVNPDTWQTGQAEFESLTAEVTARGWTIQYDANLPYFGAYWIVTPFGEFKGHGFGRYDSLNICWEQAIAAEKAEKP